jgi:hypothetical protein
MTQYLISFNDGAMTVPDEELYRLNHGMCGLPSVLK